MFWENTMIDRPIATIKSVICHFLSLILLIFKQGHTGIWIISDETCTIGSRWDPPVPKLCTAYGECMRTGLSYRKKVK
jgi:hypothetical protein